MIRVLLASAAILAIYGCATLSNSERRVAASPATEVDALAAFHRVYQVATNARCVNCHSPTDHPWQGEGPARHVHTMNVQRELSNLGASCQTCHGQSNWDQPHLPPGAHGTWTMPSKAKGYTFSITEHDLCDLWTNRGNQGVTNFFEDAAFFQTGIKRPRSGQDLIDHVRDDAGGLVAWSFAPGPGRSVPSESHDRFVADVTTWVEGSMPCPN